MPERLTDRDIDALIHEEDYYQFPGTTVTICCLTLLNGYNVVGYAACVDPVDFDEKLGREVAYEHARNKIWALEGYRMKEAQYREQ